jgi:uncharacterized protein
MINILAADKLMSSPKMYATFLLWMLAELFERMPEVGDVDKPKLVFFFDEAHLLFADAPEVLLQKIEQIVRLIRSKGIGVYFVTQNPLDVPDVVLGQLGNRVQHALRAFTPRDLKAVRAAATTLRANPKVDVEKAIGELAVGEALVSFLDEKGQPGIVERAFVLPPKSQIGPIAPDVRAQIISRSVLYGHYEKAIDRESAHEILKQRGERFTQQPQPAPRPGAEQPSYPGNFPQPPPGRIPLPREPSAPRPTGRPRDTMLESMAKSAAHAIGSSVGRQIIRGIMGSILGGGRR